jgi:hypothetical protein
MAMGMVRPIVFGIAVFRDVVGGVARPMRMVVALIACLMPARNVFSQENHRITVEVGALVSTQRSLPTDYSPSTPQPGVGGTAFGVVAGAAIKLSNCSTWAEN